MPAAFELPSARRSLVVVHALAMGELCLAGLLLVLLLLDALSSEGEVLTVRCAIVAPLPMGVPQLALELEEPG